MATPILTTKFQIPSLRQSLVPRQRLIERLELGLRCKLTVISAPAGFGKTTLLSAWVQSLQAPRSPVIKVAWISLDEGDDDPARFAAYLAAALNEPAGGSRPAGEDDPEWVGAWLQESHLVRFINRIAALPETVLILDDYHLITSPAIHDAVAFLVDHLPENMHLVLSTRADPPFPLPRLRARGLLAELRQGDLRFTTGEAAAFLNHVMGLDLSAPEVAALETRTEGWIAGLQMASLALQAQDLHATTRSDFVQAFTGSHRHVLDYLVQEVLEQQPPSIQDFLLKTSVLERLTGPLCDSILGDREIRGADEGVEGGPDPLSLPNSQATLERLEAMNLFIVPLDQERRWYRYHRLFADLLRKRLWQSAPELVPVLHRRASAWHEQQGLMPEAIDHALVAHDYGQAAALLQDSVEATLMRSEVTTFLNWMDRLPEEEVRRHPTLCFFHAWALLMSCGSMEAVEGRLGGLGGVRDIQKGGDAMAGRMLALRAYLMAFRVDMHQAVELCHQALERLPASDRFLRSICAWILSLARLDGGGLQDGKEAFRELARRSQDIDNPLIAVLALCHQAKLEVRQGHLARARTTYGRALQAATDARGRRLPVAGKALIGLGDLEREWNDLEAAAEHIAEGIELSGRWSELATFDAYFPLARIRLAQGDVEGARQAIETAQQIAGRSEATRVDDTVAELQEAYFSIVQGDVAGGMRWAQRRRLVPSETDVEAGADRDTVIPRLQKYEHLVLARLFIAQGQSAQALDLLALLLEQAGQLGRIDLLIEIQILRALACQAAGRDKEAADAVARALSLAEPGGFGRIFVGEGAPMARLLRQAASRGVAPAYVGKLLAAFGDAELAAAEAEPSHPHVQPLVEPLSEREHEVLRLLAAGMSNPEIAGELYVAVSTVRSHCKSIYGKLDVHRRWDAVRRGQELGLV